MIGVDFQPFAIIERPKLFNGPYNRTNLERRCTPVAFVGRVRRLQKHDGRTLPSCFCSANAPKQCTDASVINRKRRVTDSAASYSGNGRTSGLDNCSNKDCTMAVCWAVNANVTSFLNNSFKGIALAPITGIVLAQPP